MAWREDWLDASRVSNYSKILIAFYVVFGIAWIALSKDLVDLRGKPVGYDFITFWSASELALEGRAVDDRRLDEDELLRELAGSLLPGHQAQDHDRGVPGGGFRCTGDRLQVLGLRWRDPPYQPHRAKDRHRGSAGRPVR